MCISPIQEVFYELFQATGKGDMDGWFCLLGAICAGRNRTGHGRGGGAQIKNLEMPGMTMVFRLQDKVNIDKLKAGDKVLFHVEKIEGGYTITDLQLAP